MFLSDLNQIISGGERKNQEFDHSEDVKENDKTDNFSSRDFIEKTNYDNHNSANNHKVITDRMDNNDDYEYIDNDEDDNETVDDSSEPEYYYYYYYDYMDSGIDISHELTTHEPLPSPLPITMTNSTAATSTEKSETDN